MLENNEFGILFDFLKDALTEEGLNELAFKHFRSIQENWSGEIPPLEKIQKMIIHASQHGKVLELLEFGKQKNDYQYQRWREKLLPIENRLRGQVEQEQPPVEDPNQLFEDTIESFRWQLSEQNLKVVQQTFSQLSKSFEKIPKTSQNRNVQKKYQLAKDLFDIAQGVENLPELVRRAGQNPLNWRDDIVASYLLAQKEVKPEQQQMFRLARLDLPDSKKWHESIEILDRNEINYQPRVDWQSVPTNVRLTYKQDYVKKYLNGLNPFPVEVAEEEPGLLFHRERPLFFSSDLYKKLKNEPQLIYAPPGIGRTALALSIGRYHQNVFWLSLYLHQKEDVKVKFADQLLGFILAHPTHLIKLTQSDRELLAHFLVTYFNKTNLSNELSRCLQQLENKDWWRTADPLNQSFWKKSATKRVEQMLECIKQAERQDYDEYNWAKAFVMAAKNLGFDKILLVIDANQSDKEWILELVNSKIATWHLEGRGVTTFVFVPDEWKTVFNQRVIHAEDVSWTKDEFIEMLEHRWQTCLKTRSFPADHFDEDAWDLLLEGCLVNGSYNPRCFMTLWRFLTENKQEKDFHLLDVQEALKKLNPPAVQDAPVSAPDRNQLKKTISEKYNLSELKQLCFELNVDYDNIAGGTKDEKIMELILSFERRDELQALMKHVTKPRTGSFPKIVSNHQG